MTALREVRVVDLPTVTAPELDDLWHYERRLWQERLLWDNSTHSAGLRRLVGRGGLPGKAVQVNERTIGYTYYGIAGHLGVIGGLVVLPDWSHSEVGELLLNSTIQEMRRQGVCRIESRFISADCPWLGAALKIEGFRTYWREFLRRELRPACWPRHTAAAVALEPWRQTHLGEAAAILQAAYMGSIEAEILSLYGSVEGCRSVLDHIVNQGSCGSLVPEASASAHSRGKSLGFAVVTEVALRQAHLPQIAVLPAYQRQGIGQGLLDHCLRRLVERGYETLSLIVSRANDPALRLYQSMGFHSVLAFPVGIWQREKPAEGVSGANFTLNPMGQRADVVPSSR